jgi:hypothetical protein
MRLEWRIIALVSILAVVSCVAQQQQRGPSTAAERAKAIEITRALEQDPFNKKLHPDREWLLTLLIQVPDIHVKLCTELLGSFMKSKYKHSSEIVVQMTFSSAAFVIENPDKAADDVAQYAAGVEGVLKAYQAILKADPKAISPPLDELLQKQKQGQLADYVREAAKNCK